MLPLNARKPIFGVLLIASVALIAYWPALIGKFLWDDEALVSKSPLVHDPHGLMRIWFTRDAIDYWPVTNSAFWLEWRVWGANPVGYHLVNLLLHVVNSLLIWLILRRLAIPGGFIAALLFAVHPVNVESVAWIAQLKNLLAMFFGLLSVWTYLALERDKPSRIYGRWYWCSLIAFALAMLSKGSVAILPAVLLLLDWRRNRRVAWQDVVRGLPYWAISIALTIVNILLQTNGQQVVIRQASFAERVTGAGAAIWFYLSKAIAPISLNFVYPKWHIDAGKMTWWLPLLLAVAVTAALWSQRRTPIGRQLLFAWAFFCIALVPVLGFADIYFMRYSLVADHYQYIALIAVATIVGAIAAKVGGSAAKFALPIIGLRAGIAALMFALTALSWQQCRQYRDPETLWQATLDRNPACPLAHTNFGRELQKSGKTDEAIDHFQAAIEIDPNFAEAHCGLGSAFAASGRFDGAIRECRIAIDLQPSNAQAHNDLGGLLLTRGNFQEAITHCQKALELNPDYAEAHSNLGLCYFSAGNLDEAIAHYRRSIRLAPDNAETYNNLANALMKSLRATDAIALYCEALRIKPDYLEAQTNLALAYAQCQQPLAASRAAETAIALATSTGQTQQAARIESWLRNLQNVQLTRQ